MRCLLLATTIGLGSMPWAPGPADAQGAVRPNVVLIITDDLGRADIGSYGATDIRTPSIDSLAGRKSTVWEGGIRVPALVRWPDRIPAGKVSGQVGITMDLTASILAVTSTSVPDAARLEGMNLFPVWEGTGPEVERTLFWRARAATRSQAAVRRGDWKLVSDAGHTYVFNVRTDSSERDDLANRRQDIAQVLWPLVRAWEQGVDAEAAEAAAPSGGG